MTKAIIIDDEIKSRLTLEKLLVTYCPDVSVAGSCGHIGEAYQMIVDIKPQVLFLDIEMIGSTGFDLLEQFDIPDFHIIFVTAHSQYAVKAFKYSATDYLLKPVDVDELVNAVKKVTKQLSEPGENDFTPKKLLSIRTIDTELYIDPAEIIHLEADGSYTKIYLHNGEHHYLSTNLGNYEPQLDSNVFVRIHKSHIINLNHLKRVSRFEGFVEMVNGRRIKISRRNKEYFFSILKKTNRS